MIRLHRKRAHLLLAALLATLPVSALAEFDWIGKYAGDYIGGQSNARLLALGGAGVAIAQGPSGIMANPALLEPTSLHTVSLMHVDRFASAVKVDHAAYMRRTASGRPLGFGLVRQGVDDIPVTRLRDPSRPLGNDNRVIATGSTAASEYAFFLATVSERSWGRIGGAAKLLYKRLDTRNAWGIGLDVGYARRFGDLTLGAQVRDALTTILVWDTGLQEGIVPTWRAGAAWELALDRLQAVAVPVVELSYRTESLGDDNALELHTGLEYRIREVVAVRIGLDGDRLAYGAGLQIGPVRLDYAFVGHEELGATHRVSVGAAWGRIP